MYLNLWQRNDGRRFAKCPRCEQEVGLGTAGVGNIKKIHLFKESCNLAKKKLDAKTTVREKGKPSEPKKTFKARLITTFFGAGAAPLPNPSTVPSVGPIVPLATAPVPVSSPVVVPVPPATNSAPALSASPVAQAIIVEDSPPAQHLRSAPFVPDNILEEIAYLIPLIPMSIPEAATYDRIASFSGDPSKLDDVSIPGDELWEQFLNKHLKEIRTPRRRE
ncbi:hypothetical protein D9619_008392 [Psilocybe cf. subviscida]|uniref:Uncharacterized protein n=1 Tax=Psilocybe cf. subviscida TaxID=2480587 RepID=A0A8H5BAK1_9AGAR|nr:hypothetical protein D9619_008392 [Psilocybe cf. subviscida]